MIEGKETYGEVFCKSEGLSEDQAKEKCRQACIKVDSIIHAECLELIAYNPDNDTYHFKFKVIQT